MFYKVLICVVALMNLCVTHKILLVFYLPLKSHHMLGVSMINLLLEAGHEITYITPTPVAYSHPNLSEIVIKLQNLQGASLNALLEKPLTLNHIFDSTLNVTYTALANENVLRLLEDPTQSFDLVITTWTFMDLNSGFSALFNCPYIWFFTFQDDHEILRLIHEYANPAVTTNMKTNNVPVFNFMQRVQELVFFITYRARKYIQFEHRETKAYEELFSPLANKRGRTLPPYEEVRYNASLALVNSHLTIRDMPLAPQNYKAIGGFHISKTLEPISKELLTVIENSKNGVVILSFGSLLRAEDLPRNIKRDLLTMFSTLNYTILWKIGEKFEDLPSNVRTFDWMPLQSVLAHPQCVLFITHGGMLSLSESVHFGVPIVGVPVFGDQTVNVKTIIKRGVGRMVAMGPNLADVLKEAIEDVLTDPRYRQNMKSLSKLYHDRPWSPGSELVYWVEHVINTQGAPHLRSSALLLPWYQKYYVDFIAALLVFLVALLFITRKVFACVVNRIKNGFRNNVTLSKKSL